jgi:hypothetical protein
MGANMTNATCNRQQPMRHSPLDIGTPKELGHDE